MEGNKPVVSDFMRELIVKQAGVIGEDGMAMVEDIESAAVCPVNKLLPADVFKMIEWCEASLKRRVAARMQSDAITAEKEPERLKQLEAIREQATMLHGSRLIGDKITEESLVRLMRNSVIEFMAAGGSGCVGRTGPGYGPIMEGAGAGNSGRRRHRDSSSGRKRRGATAGLSDGGRGLLGPS